MDLIILEFKLKEIDGGSWHHLYTILLKRQTLTLN